jgi:hypothetical protein
MTPVSYLDEYSFARHLRKKRNLIILRKDIPQDHAKDTYKGSP